MFSLTWMLQTKDLLMTYLAKSCDHQLKCAFTALLQYQEQSLLVPEKHFYPFDFRDEINSVFNDVSYPSVFFFFLKLVMVNAWSSNMVYCIGDRNVDLWSLKLILIQRHIRPTWQNNSHLLECFHGHILCSAKSAKSCPLGLEIGKIENRLSGKALLSRGHLARTSGSGGKRGLWIFGDGSFTSAVSGERRRLSKEVILFPSVTQAAYTWANLD